MNITTLSTTELALSFVASPRLCWGHYCGHRRCGFFFESAGLKDCALSLAALNTTAL